MSTTGDVEVVLPLDGNAVAGLLGEVFAFDATVARIACSGCSTVASVGEARLYGGAMGVVLRCSSCDAVMVRLVRTPAGYWLDMQGARNMFVAAGRA